MAVDYQQPSWQTPQGNEGTVLAGIIQRSRQLDQNKQSRTFEQGRETSQDAMQKQEFNARIQAAARKLSADTKFQQGVSTLKQDDPDYQKKYLSLMLQHASETGQYGAGIGSTINALKPTAEPKLTPFPTGQPSSNPTAPPSAAATPPQGFQGGYVTDAKGNVHIVPPPKPTSVPRPIISKPGDVVIDPSTLKPVYTNTLSKATSPQPIAPRIVPPGGVVYEGGKPTYTNTAPRSVTGKSAEPLAMPASKDDLKLREVYQTSKGSGWWDGEQFHLLK